MVIDDLNHLFVDDSYDWFVFVDLMTGSWLLMILTVVQWMVSGASGVCGSRAASHVVKGSGQGSGSVTPPPHSTGVDPVRAHPPRRSSVT